MTAAARATESLANCQTGCTVTRVCVGIDKGVYLSAIYGPMTPLYVTYSAMREHQLDTAGLGPGDNRIDSPTLDLYAAARDEWHDTASACGIASPPFYQLPTELQEAVQEAVDARVPPAVLEYLMHALEEHEQGHYLSFLQVQRPRPTRKHTPPPPSFFTEHLFIFGLISPMP